MADAVPPEQSPRPEPPFPWYGGLSARLLALTIVIVVLANILILPPYLAAYEEQWLLDRLRAAELATLVQETAPGGVVSDRVRSMLLANAEVVSVALQADGERRLILQGPRTMRTPYLVDLRSGGPLSWTAPLRTLTFGGDRMIRVMAKPRFRAGEFVEIVASDGPLKRQLLAQLGSLMAIAAFTSVMAGAVVYLALNLVLVRPMQRITRSMERFRVDPESRKSGASSSKRRDEIGVAERELARMQTDLRAALVSRARLAALGEAVAKINHDLRNMLTSAQLASERLSGSGDPKVAQALPRLERALDRAVTLASNVLTFGSSAEPKPIKSPIPLRAAIEAAADDAGLEPGGVALRDEVGDTIMVRADAEQLHRILVNLLRNARQAVDGVEATEGRGAVVASARIVQDSTIVVLSDDGPGLPSRAQANLFQPFAGSTRRGGTGLGLAIARELAQGHGGDVVLISTSAAGTTFEVRLPNAPD